MKPVSASRTHRQKRWIKYITFIVQHNCMTSNQSKQHMHLFSIVAFQTDETMKRIKNRSSFKKDCKILRSYDAG